MASVSNSVFKYFFVALLLGLTPIKSAAQTDTVQLALREYHSANITATVPSTIHPYYFTADEYGKILAHSTETKRAVKTIKPASGIPIKSLRLSHDDRIIIANQKYEFSDGSVDSVFYIRIFDQQVVKKDAANIEFIGNQTDAILIQDTNPQKTLNIINVYDKYYEHIHKFFASQKVTIGAYNQHNGEMAMVQKETWGLNQKNILLLKKDDYKYESTVDIPKSHKIQSLFYNTNRLYAIAINSDTKSVEFHCVTENQNFSNPVHTIDDYNAYSISALIHSTNNETQIAITNSTSNLIPIIIELKQSKFKTIKTDIDYGATTSLYLEDTNEYLFFEEFNPNLSSKASFRTFNNKNNKTTTPAENNKYHTATFLPNNNWMVLGQDIKTTDLGFGKWEYKIKYYEKGTFNNRFAKLNYNDYLESKHGIEDLSSSGFGFDKKTGLRIFWGYDRRSTEDNKSGFYEYDLIKDNVQLITRLDINKNVIIDYNKTKNYILLSQKEYYNGGYTDPQSFSIIDNGKEITLDGLYKFGKFSNNGNYLLLISDNNTLTIRKTNGDQIIHTEILTDGKYNILSLGEMEFILSNSYYILSTETCNQNSTSYEVHNDNTVSTQNTDCINIIDAESKNDVVAIIVEYLGLIIGDRVLKYIPGEFPVNISLNKDGSTAMASFNNGKIKLIDTKSLEVVAEMLHPDKDSHIFTDSSNHYFSNVEPEPFLISTKNGVQSSLQDLSLDHYDPEAILKVFGEPNQDYISALNKSLSIRAKKQTIETDNSNITSEIKISAPGDLYVLSIGVSDYKESAYNLTYADKDAFDIANIYGTQSKAEITAYNNKFHSHQFTLNGSDDNPVLLRKYYGQYMSLSELHPLTQNGLYWLEDNDNSYFLWDFKDKNISPLKLPDNFNIDIYNFDTHILPSPDNDGFYYTTKNGKLLHYNITTKQASNTTFRFKDDEHNFDNLAILKNNRWAYLSHNDDYGKQNLITITINQSNSDSPTNISFDPTIVHNKSKLDTIHIAIPQLKAISSNGAHLLYTDHNEQLYYKNLKEALDPPRLINNIPVESLDKWSITNDARLISIITETSINTYNLQGLLQETRIIGENEIGTVLQDGNPSWISIAQSMVEEPFLDAENLLNKTQPHSFKKSHVLHLTNNKATKSVIINKLSTFFENARPNDQVILFLAGHGVLDEDLNYYFAPHDMLFDKVKQNGLSFKTILDELKKVNTNNTLLLMDSCHSGNTLDMDTKTTVSEDNSNDPNQRGSKSRKSNPQTKFKISTIVTDLFEDFMSKSGITIISASSGEDVAYENKILGNGAFTSAYIKILKERLKGGGFVLTEENVSQSIDFTNDDIIRIMKQVSLSTKGKQTPDLREFNPQAKIKIW